MSTRTITIDSITRLEGHGKIEIFLNKEGNVENAYFQVPELRGLEKGKSKHNHKLSSLFRNDMRSC